MRSGLTLFTLLGLAAASCGTSDRHFSNAGAGGQSGGSGGGSDSAGRSGNAGSGVAGHGTPPGDAGSAGTPSVGDAGAGGASDEGPPDLCVGVKCDSPPASDCLSGTEFQSYDTTGTCTAGQCKYVSHSISCTCKSHACTSDPCAGLSCATPPSASCKDANTLLTYSASGTCSGGSCSYASTETTCAFGCANNACKPDPCTTTMVCKSPPASTCKDASTRTTYATSGTCSAGKCSYGTMDAPCSGDTPKCKDPGTGSQCVACLSSADCSNGGTCNSSNACVCSNRFNGKHCEFQVFRGLGTVPGDASSSASGISHDGSIIFGTSVGPDGVIHAFRAVNGGAIQFIPKPNAATAAKYCLPKAADSAGNIVLICDESSVYLYSPGGTATPVTWPANAASNLDISLDGKVLVGGAAGDQAIRRQNSTNTLIGPLTPNGGSDWFNATNGDGSIAVGTQSNVTALTWTSNTGLTPLTLLTTWVNAAAADVSTDGKVVVGWASDDWEILSGRIAVKWTGSSLAPTALSSSPSGAAALAVNGDGSVIVGRLSPDAMLWDNAGAHTIKSLLGGTTDFTSDWTLDSAVGVSDDGKWVVGTGTHQTRGEAFVVHLP